MLGHLIQISVTNVFGSHAGANRHISNQTAKGHITDCNRCIVHDTLRLAEEWTHLRRHLIVSTRLKIVFFDLEVGCRFLSYRLKLAGR